jgi:hypothetical protein
MARQLASCGINILDNSAAVVRLVLIYLDRNPNNPSPQDLADAGTALGRIRPYVRTIDSSSYIQALANGELCIALGYNGDIVQARNRAREAKNGISIAYTIPSQGSLLPVNSRCAQTTIELLSHADRGGNLATHASARPCRRIRSLIQRQPRVVSLCVNMD